MRLSNDCWYRWLGTPSAGVVALGSVVLVGSRLLFVSGEPWEQDEALFAAASLDTDMEQGRPHPPGFPLWIALGKIGLAVVGDPVLALQLLSAMASILTVVLLVDLWGRALASPPLGVASAALFAFAPAVLFFAPRALTTTPALCLAVVAVALWVRPGRWSLVLGSSALACAVLVRPILAPPVLVVAVAAMALRRERLSGLATAAAVFAVSMAAGLLPLVLDVGSIEGYLALLERHGTHHGGALRLGPWSLGDLGIVKAVGGPVPALVVAILTAVGWLRLARTRLRLALWWLSVAVATGGWMLLAHNRSLMRYAPPLVALVSGPVVVGCLVVLRSRRLTGAAVMLAATLGLVWTAPALVAQVSNDFPPLDVLRSVQTGAGDSAVIVDGALSPFTDYLQLAGRGRRPVFWRPLLAEDRVPWPQVRGPWNYVWTDGSAGAWIPAPGQPRRVVECRSDRLRLLAGRRFLTAWETDRGGLVISPQEPHVRTDGSIGVDPEVGLLLQPTVPGSWLGAVLKVGGVAEVELVGGRQGARRTRLQPGVQYIHVRLDQAGADAASRPTRVALRNRGPGSVRLMRVWIDSADGRHTPDRMTVDDQAAGLGGRIDGDGFHSVERLVGERPGRWTGSRARLSVPAGDGCLVVSLCAPRPDPAQMSLSSRELGWSHALEVGERWTEVEVPSSGHGRLTLVVDVANPFVPLQRIPGSGDRRELGVVVGEIRFVSACSEGG